jgi:hypothetical protein
MDSLNFNSNDGLAAVALFVSWLSKNNKKFRHATMDEQHNEIDIITQKQDAEVKTTKKYTQVAIEEIGDCGKPGWIYTTQSTVMVFVNVKEKFAWIIPTNKLREYYNETKHSHPIFKNYRTIGTRGDVWVSSYRWYSIDEIKEQMQVTKIKLK